MVVRACTESGNAYVLAVDGIDDKVRVGGYIRRDETFALVKRIDKQAKALTVDRSIEAGDIEPFEIARERSLVGDVQRSDHWTHRKPRPCRARRVRS